MVADGHPDAAPWRVTARSVTGAKHRERGVGCDDFVSATVLSNGWRALALADGAGSASAAALGAQTAVQAVLRAVDVVAARLEGASDAGRVVLLGECFAGARGATLRRAEEENRPPGDLSATLALVLLAPGEVIAAQVGDGAVVLRGAKGEAETLLIPDNGEHLNETVFLISPPAAERLQVGFAKGARSVAAFTDGLQLPALRVGDWSPFQPFFKNVLDFFEQVDDPAKAETSLERFLNSDKIAEASSDDLTLAVATRPPPPEAALEIRRAGHVPETWTQKEVTP